MLRRKFSVFLIVFVFVLFCVLKFFKFQVYSKINIIDNNRHDPQVAEANLKMLCTFQIHILYKYTTMHNQYIFI